VRLAGKGVRFFGGLQDAERREMVKRAWVLVNPSIREGWGLNVVEASASGVPCVAYDVAGLRDSVKNGVTGFLVKAGSTESLAEGVMEVLSGKSLRETLSKNALEYSRQFSWDNTTKEFQSVLERMHNEG